MPLFEIEQYELHTQKYRIEADSEAEAIDRLYKGKADPVGGSRTYIEVAEDFGLPADENRKLVETLNKLGHNIDPDDVIPSIRDVQKVEAPTPATRRRKPK